MFGYFDAPYQEIPAYDPGLGVDCPVCNRPLSRPVVTTSLMVPGDGRSYFYRMHKACRAGLTPEAETNIDSVLVDAVVAARNSN
jgi:hypothetical protein